MSKKILIIGILIVVVLANLPPYFPQNKAVAAEQKMKEISTTYRIPNPITSAGGVDYYGDEWSADLGEVDISQLNIPSNAKITSVQVYDSKGNYVKHLNDRNGTKYRIGRVNSTESVTIYADIRSDDDYFEWWRTSNQNVWAYELDGIWHFRKFSQNTAYPIPNGTYQNVFAGRTVSTNGYRTNGNIPSGYSPSHQNYLTAFYEEAPGQAHMAWGSRQNIYIGNATFYNYGVQLDNVPFNKLHNIAVQSISYRKPASNGLEHGNILDYMALGTSADMIRNQNVLLWYKARYGDEGFVFNGEGTQIIRRYFNAWDIRLTSKLYKYDQYKVRVYYEEDPNAKAWLDLNANIDSCPVVGDTIQIKAKITKKDGTVWEFLVTEPHAKLAYTTSNSTVAPVSNTGLVRLNAAGNVVITATYTEGDGSAPITETISIMVNDNRDSCDPTTPPPSGGGTCPEPTISSSPSETRVLSNLTDSPTGVIDSQSGEFDVVQGIPSSEYLRTYVIAPKYLFDQRYEKQEGKVVYTVPAKKTFILEWEETPASGGDAVKKTETEVKEVQVQIEKPFSYWNVTTFDVWNTDNALITNYALPNGQSLMYDSNKVTANANRNLSVNAHVFPTACEPVELPEETINGGSSKPSTPDITDEAKSVAEGKIQPPNVKNDRAVFNGSTIMSDSMTTEHAPTPMDIPLPDPNDFSLYNDNLLIEPTKTNYWQSPSTGKMTYIGIFGLNGTPSSKELSFAVNTVTVHTPVVIYATATDDKEHDQRINPPIRSTPANSSVDRHAFILDRPFTVTLPTIGQHRNIPGYGYRDFSKYIKKKQVIFPFDVYTETKQGFYPANTWIDVPSNMTEATFFMPVWVTEGQYVVQFRSFAINALDSGDFGGSEELANITIPNGNYNVAPAGTLSAAHIAETSIKVDVVGRLYDFQVTDIEDYNWKNVFRNTDMTASGKSYFVGLKGIDNEARGNRTPYVLPISHASNPNGIKNLAVKQGYSFSFNFKTKGDMQSAKDAIRITPRFYYVNKDGSGRQEVDLYYHDNLKKFIKIGSNEDQAYRTVKLNETSRNVSPTEITNNAIHYFNYAARFNLTDVVSEHTRTSYARSYAKHYSKDEIKSGPYGWQILNWKLRTYRGPQKDTVPTNTMIPSEEIVTKEQTWYGEYSIPANTYVVSKNAPIHEAGRLGVLNDNHPIFLKDGYIIVNFDIETINEGDLANPYLSYHNAFYMSQWTDMEEFQPSFVDRYGKTFSNLEGDVIYYHANQSSLDDFAASVTH